MGIVFNPFTGTFDFTGSATPGGSTTQVQFNSSGAFGGSANLTWITDPSPVAWPNKALRLQTNRLLIGADGLDIFGTAFPSNGGIPQLSVFNATVDTSTTGGYTGVSSEVDLYGTGGSSGQFNNVWALTGAVQTQDTSTASVHLLRGGNFFVEHYGSGVIVNRISGFEAFSYNEASSSPSGSAFGIIGGGHSLGGSLLQATGVRGRVEVNSSTLALGNAIYGWVHVSAGSIVTDAIVFDAQEATITAATTTNYYGMRLADQSGLSISGNNHAINYGAGKFIVNSAGAITSLSTATATDFIGGTWQGKTLTLANSLITSGNFSLTLTTTNTTNVTFPTTGTLATLAGSEALTNKTVNGLTITSTTGTLTIPNSASLITSGAFAVTLTATGTTGVTLPTSGTLLTTAGSGASLTFPGTLAIASGKVATINNTLTFAGTDSTTMTFPTTSATIARTDAANTFVGTQGFSAALTDTLSINATSTDALILTNTTPAALGAQQWSPRLRFTGQGWKTNSGGSTQTGDVIVENQMTQGAGNPTTYLTFSAQLAGGGYSTVLQVGKTEFGVASVQVNNLLADQGGNWSIGAGGSQHGFRAGPVGDGFNWGNTLGIYLETAGSIAGYRNGTTATTFNFYNTYTSASVFERFNIAWVSNVLHLGNVTTGATARVMQLDYGGTTTAAISIPITSGAITFGGGVTLADAGDIVVGSTTGTKIGTATTQKIGFYNATPIVQVPATTDLGLMLSNLGLRAVGTTILDSPKVTTGVNNDGSGLKHSRVTTGSIGIGSTALVTVTWANAFADANYTVQASVVDSTTTSLSLSVVHIESVAAGSITVRVLNNSATTALTGTLHATAIHD